MKAFIPYLSGTLFTGLSVTILTGEWGFGVVVVLLMNVIYAMSTDIGELG